MLFDIFVFETMKIEKADSNYSYSYKIGEPISFVIVHRYYGDEESMEEEEFASSAETSDSSKDVEEKVSIDFGCSIGCLLMKLYCR